MSNKDRGKYFENYVVANIKTYLNLKNRDIYRSSTSGNYSKEYGDITFSTAAKINDEVITIYPWIIECKFQKNWSMSMMFSHSKEFQSHWLELEQQTEKYIKNYPGIIPLKSLIISKPYEKVWIIFKKENLIDNSISKFDLNKLEYFIVNNNKNMIITELKQFLFTFSSELCSIKI